MKEQFRRAAAFIVLTEFCERLCYYGVAGNLVLFLQTRFGLTNSAADIEMSAWSGCCYVTPLLGGLIADRYLGRFTTIVLFTSIYLLGLLLLVFSAAPLYADDGDGSGTDNFNGKQRVLLFCSIYLIALGAGGIKPNVSTMGADQFIDEADSVQESNLKQRFFNWFYFSINCGALISNTLVAYLCEYGIPSLGGVKWSFFVGFSVPAVAMGAGLAVFCSGHKLYQMVPPSFTSLCEDCTSLCSGTLCSGNKNKYQTAHMDNDESSNNMSTSMDRGMGMSVNTADDQSGLVTEESADENDTKPPPEATPELPRQQHPTTSILKLVPFLLLMVGYWSVYGQLSTTFQNQGCQMNRSVGSIEVPVAALQAFDTIAVLVLVPVFDQAIYPLFRRIGRPLPTLQRIAAGFAVALAAMIVAAIVESYRRLHAPSALYYNEWSSDASAVALSPCQSINDYNPNRYQQWLISVEKSGDHSLSHISKPTSCSHVPIEGSCSNYRFYSTPGSSLHNGTTTGSCLIISCQSLPQVSTMNVLWQIPQFVLIGASEVLSSVASLEFFYSQAGPRNRGLVQSLNLLTTAVGSFITIPLVLAVNSKPGSEWLPQNIDTGHLDWFFLVLAGVMGASLVAFVYAAKGYQYIGMGREEGNDSSDGRRTESFDEIGEIGQPTELSDLNVESTLPYPKRRESEVGLIVVPHTTNQPHQNSDRVQDHDQAQDEAANPMLGLEITRTTRQQN